MKTSTTYNRAFWNLVRGSSDQHNDLQEGSDYQTGAYFLPPNESTSRFLAALSKENIFRRIATTINATTKGGSIIASDACTAADWIPENSPIPEAEQLFKQYRVQESPCFKTIFCRIRRLMLNPISPMNLLAALVKKKNGPS